MRRILTLTLVSALLLLLCAKSHAAIADSSTSGFTIKLEYTIQNPADSVFLRLMDIGKWWDPEHTYSRNAGNLSIDTKAGGCFCERLPDGGSVRHMTVLYMAPGKTLRMEGGLGPLQAVAISAVMTITLSQSCNSTSMEVTYAVGGYLHGGLARLAPMVEKVLSAQMERLRDFAEK